MFENRQIPNSSIKDVPTLLTLSQLVQMELQLQRQQAQAQRQTLDRLARRPPATSAPAQVVSNRLILISSLQNAISGSAKHSHPGNLELKQRGEVDGGNKPSNPFQLPSRRAHRGGGGGDEGGR